MNTMLIFATIDNEAWVFTSMEAFEVSRKSSSKGTCYGSGTHVFIIEPHASIDKQSRVTSFEVAILALLDNMKGNDK